MIVLLIFLACCCEGVSALYNVNVGVILVTAHKKPAKKLPYRYELVGPVIDMASEVAREEHGINFTKHVFAHRGSCDFNVIGKASELFFNDNCLAMIGPGCSGDVRTVTRLGNHLGFPTVTGAADTLFEKHYFPLLTRLSYNLQELGGFVATLLQHFEWEHVAVLYSTATSHRKVGGALVKRLGKTETVAGVEGISFQLKADLDHGALLKEASGYARVFFIITYQYDLRSFMLEAHTLGMTKGEYAFFAVELFYNDVYGEDVAPWQYYPDDGLNEKAKEAYQSLFFIALLSHYKPIPGIERFHDILNETAKTNFGYPILKTDLDSLTSYFLTAFYDAVIYLALAYNRTLMDGEDPTDGKHVAQKLWNHTFSSFFGDVYVNSHGDRAAAYVVLDMTDVEAGVYSDVINQKITQYTTDLEETLSTTGKVLWPGNGEKPVNMPRCGFKGDAEICQPHDHSSVIMAAVCATIVIIILAGVVAFLVYRKVKYEWQLSRVYWEILWEDVVESENNQPLQSQMSLTSSMDSRSFTKFDQSVTTQGTRETAIPIFTTVGVYHGTQVAIRKFHSSGGVLELSHTKQQELKQRAITTHENLVRFIGACVIEGETFCTLVAYCSKGSLEDILGNEGIKLDWVFKYSLINDIVRGMQYLHSTPIGVHGRLQSSNCVVDSQLSVKITDFGMASFYAEGDLANKYFDTESQHEQNLIKRKMWVAPERLRAGFSMATVAGDVYAFGIIMQEIITREAPFFNWELEPPEIVHRVSNVESPPFRPVVQDETCRDDLLALMQLCWIEDQYARPPFRTIQHKMNKITKGSRIKGTVVENQLRHLEKYAENMEALIAERTKECTDQKNLTENILSTIMPQPIAEKLKEGESVALETFDSASIFFSTLLHFSAITKYSSPIEMVDFLNDFYREMDQQISQYDVHKMEGLNDSYMIVSGIYMKTEKNHVKEIAHVALAIMAAVEHYVIKHLPETRLEMRMGIHTGACTAGVVGTVMPNFGVFGQTVHIAAEMEKTGKGSKIHTSKETYDILSTLGGFMVSLRGNKDIQGVGTVTTYFLDGIEIDSMKGGSEKEMEVRNLETDTPPVQGEAAAHHVDSETDRLLHEEQMWHEAEMA